jgi:hypothetical protein
LNSRELGTHFRRRRTWYRRRLRVRRVLLSVTMISMLAGACWQSVARRLSLPRLQTTSFLPESFWARGDVHQSLAFLSHAPVVYRARPGRGTYPYSVVPGGVTDAADLRERAARDFVVRRHFSGFNFQRARMVRAEKAREVYLSYRLHDRIFWTRKKVRLLEAELLLTDGAITARARCGNQISETPKADVSDDEPDQDVLDRPVAEMAALGPALPIRFPNVHPELPGADALSPEGPQLFAGGFNFPYVDFGPDAHHICKADDKDKRCRHNHKPPAVPEPGSWILIASGLAAICWRVRRRTEGVDRQLLSRRLVDSL